MANSCWSSRAQRSQVKLDACDAMWHGQTRHISTMSAPTKQPTNQPLPSPPSPLPSPPTPSPPLPPPSPPLPPHPTPLHPPPHTTTPYHPPPHQPTTHTHHTLPTPPPPPPTPHHTPPHPTTTPPPPSLHPTNPPHTHHTTPPLPTPPPPPPTIHTTTTSRFVLLFFLMTKWSSAVVDMVLHGDQGSAWRRRQPRLRPWWRHEQQTVAMALSAAAHHSFHKVAAGEKYNALRGQKTDRARREVEERELHDAPRRQKPPPPGTRPAPLVEVRPQMVYERHCGFELVLNVAAPQMDREVVAPMITFVEQIVGIPARGGPAPFVSSTSQQCYKHQRQR